MLELDIALAGSCGRSRARAHQVPLHANIPLPSYANIGLCKDAPRGVHIYTLYMVSATVLPTRQCSGKVALIDVALRLKGPYDSRIYFGG